MINTGDKLPLFQLPDHTGKLFDISSLLGKQNIVLFFYPKDGSPGCTAEACTFRDAYEEFLKANCEVIGISGDGIRTHVIFKDKHKLPFILLSDRHNELQSQFGIKKLLGILPARVTFLVDKQGIVRHVFSSQFLVKRHVKSVLKALNEM